jgi:esterase/lipase superfamily enzyme
MAKPPKLLAVEAGSPPARIVRIYYATDRAVTREGTSIVTYTNRPVPAGAPLNLGTCQVTIPPNHVTGRFERPSLIKLEFKETPEKHVTLGTVRRLDAPKFWADLRGRVTNSSAREVFVFIHGFNNTFQDAAMTAGQLAFDLGFDDARGAPILYSWCSKGETTGYGADELAVTNTVQRLEEFLHQVARDSGANAVHLLAHSMGNRALTQALHRMSATRALAADAPPFHQLVLAAPDVDSRDFESISRAVASTSRHASLYWSKRDVALLASAVLHGHWRLGETGIAEGFDSLDVSAAVASLKDITEHSYYHECPPVVLDLYRLFGCKCPTRDRCNRCFTRPVDASPWRFTPVEGCRHLNGQP